MEEQLAIIMERIEAAEKWRDATYGELWQDCYRRYRSQALPAALGSNIFVPQTFMQCEVIKSRLREALFRERPYIAALPVEGADREHAANMQLLLDWQMNERMGLERLVGEEVATNLVVYGSAVTYTGWQLQTRRVTQAFVSPQPLSDATGQPLLDDTGQALTLEGLQPVSVEAVIYDDPLVANIALGDFFVDPEATDIAAARFCGHREFQTKEALQQLVDQGKYQIDWEELDENTVGNDEFYASDQAKARLEVHHYWEDERHLVLLSRQQLICDEPNPFWHGMKPYDKCCYVPLPGEFYGMGVPEILSGLQDELNTARNQRIDYNSMALRRMWKLRRGCGLTARDLVWRQNGVLQVENMDDIMEINIQDLPATAFANEAAIKQDMQDTTGCHDILMGLSYTNETATTTVTRDNNASLRFKVVISSMINDLLVPIARKCAALNQQFLSELRLLRILGAEDDTDVAASRGIGPYDLSGNFDIVFCGGAVDSAANKQLNKERALQAYSLALADSAYQADDQARLRLFRRVLEALEIKDAASLLPQAAGDSSFFAAERSVPLAAAAAAQAKTPAGAAQ